MVSGETESLLFRWSRRGFARNLYALPGCGPNGWELTLVARAFRPSAAGLEPTATHQIHIRTICALRAPITMSPHRTWSLRYELT